MASLPGIGGWVSDLFTWVLDRYLNPYFENVQNVRQDIGLLSGTVSLKNLKLKKGALDNLRLPVDVRFGYLGEFYVKVPWRNLTGEAAQIIIRDLYVVAVPAAGRNHDPVDDEKRAQAAKRDRLESAEQFASKTATHTPDDGAKTEGYLAAMQNKILNNLQITVENIHVRYEDDQSCPGHPLAAGITLSSFTAKTTDEGWKVLTTFPEKAPPTGHKLGSLNSLGVYFNTDETMHDNMSHDETIAMMKSQIASDGNVPQHQFMVKPVSGDAHVTFRKSVEKGQPWREAQVTFQDLGVALDEDQYRDIISMLDMYHFYNRQAQYRKYRPTEAALEENPGRARLLFGFQAIHQEVCEKNAKWTWEYLKARGETRKEYVALFKEKLTSDESSRKTFTPIKAQRLTAMEDPLTYEDIRFFRSIARAEIKKDKALKKQMEQQKAKQQPPPATGIWGYMGWGKPSTTTTVEPDQQLQEEILQAIDYNENDILPSNLPEDAVKYRIGATLKQGSFGLRRKRAGPDDEEDIVTMVFDASEVEALLRPENFEATISLGGLSVFDGTSPRTLHKKIVRVKNDPTKHLPFVAMAAHVQKPVDESLFYLNFVQNPLDKKSDSAVTIRMKAMEIIYHRGYIEEIFRFFRPPESQLESVNALLSAAGETIGELRKQSRAGFEYALQTHKTLDVNLDMESPIIIIPEDVRSASGQHMILDAGHISIKSNLVPKSEISSIRSKQTHKYEDKDFEKLESLMYDKYYLKLEAAQLVLGNSLDSCLAALSASHEGQELHLLERINMAFSVENSIVPDAANLTRLRITGKLPELTVNFSNLKYKGLMRLIDIAIPQLGDASNLQGQQSESLTVPMTAVSTTFSRQEIEYLVPHDDHSDDEAPTKPNEKSKDVKSAVLEPNQALIHQVTFELGFSVDKLQISLFKSSAAGAEKLLAEVALRSFAMKFAMAMYDMKVELALKSITMDRIEGSSRRIPIILSSTKEAESATVTQPSDLIQVFYRRVQSESPEYIKVYEGVDQTVDVHLSTFVLHAAPEPIIDLYDFLMTTFVADHPGAEEPPRPSNTEAQAVDHTNDTKSKMKIRVDLTAIEVTLLDNDESLATLLLSTASVDLFMDGNKLRLSTRLGDFSLTDDSEWKAANPLFKKIVSIEGSDLADLSYETFDPADHENFTGINSMVHLEVAAIKLNYVERPVGRIYAFLIKFAKLKALYDTASEVAVQKASEITRMKFDVLIKSPIIFLPQDPAQSQDALAVHLGEIFAANSFHSADSTILAGIRGIRLHSRFYDSGELLKLKIIEDVEITCKVSQFGDIDRAVNVLQPDTMVDVTMSDVKISLTQRQYIALVKLSQSIPRALTTDTTGNTNGPTPAGQVTKPDDVKSTDNDTRITPWATLELAFAVKTLSLRLFDAKAVHEMSLAKCGIVEFSLDETVLRYKSSSDGASYSEVTLKSFTLNNTRPGNSRFREIIPPARLRPKQHRYMFMASYATTGGSRPSSTAIITIDSPKILFAVDPVFALLSYLQSPFVDDPEVEESPTSNTGSGGEKNQKTSDQQPESSLSIRVDLYEVSVTVLERDDDPNTQAICLTIDEILMSKQGVLALTVTQLGMSLLCMSSPEDAVSFLEKLDVSLSLDNRIQAGHDTMTVDLNLQPIIIRASLRDINLILSIFARAAELSAKSQTSTRHGAVITATPPSSNLSLPSTQAPPQATLIVTNETLKASFDGFRVVLIGDIHELPILHLSVPNFAITATEWSTELQANTLLSLNLTYWNLNNSHWEPLIDPWTVSGAVRKDVQTGTLITSLSSQTRLDLNITTSMLELALDTANVWSKEGDRALKRSRGGEAPYRIINRTGIPLKIWSEQDGKTLQDSTFGTLTDGESREWRFDDWKTLRERISDARGNSIAVQFSGKSWEAVRNIPVDREGHFVYVLQPQSDKVSQRFLCEISVKENVKVVTLRSTYKLENSCLYGLEVCLFNTQNRPAEGYPLVKLAPGESYYVPIAAVLETDIKVQLDPGFGYGWPSKALRWQDMLRANPQTISCSPKEGSKEEPFRIHAWALYDSADPINRTYPKMTIRLQAPLELENLLPYDIRYSIYEKDSEKTWHNYLRRGGLMPIHCVHLNQVVIFNAELQEIPFAKFKPSEYALVNTDDTGEFRVESTLSASDESNRKLDLGINYVKHEDAGGAFRFQVYSPYIAINKTGVPITIRSGTGKVLAGQGSNALVTTSPFLFSHPSKHGTDFTLSLATSEWSKVLSFDAPGAETTITLGAKGSAKETYLGVSWATGTGKYKLTKVITITPRFLIRNELAREIVIRECGETGGGTTIGSNSSLPMLDFTRGRDPSVSLKYTGVESKWSSPVILQNIGVIHTRLAASATAQPDLARLEISMGGPTIWLVIKPETGGWPFAIENKSTFLVTFSQKDERKSPVSDEYTLPPDSQLPYAWDYPAAPNKRLRLKIGDSTRSVDIMEIGLLVPFKFKSGEGGGVVSLDVRASGPTQVLTISKYTENRALYRRRPRSATMDSTLSRSDTISSQNDAFEAVTADIPPSLAINLDFEGIGLSLVNRRLVEVVYVTLSKLQVDYTDSPVAQSLRVVCRWIQVDNQLQEAIYPIVLQPSIASREDYDVIPAVQMSAILLKDQSHGVMFVKYASVLLQALSIQMDEDFLFALLDLTKLRGVSWEDEGKDALTEYPVEFAPPRGAQEGQDMYFEVLELQPMRLSLSFMRTERVNAEEKLTLRNPLAVVLNALTMTLGNVNDAPLRFNALAIKDMRLTVPDLQDRIMYHYRQEVLRQLYRILGSADFIGNPVGLFNNVSSGVADIFYEPYKGVVRYGTKELGVGIAKGAASFAMKTVFGLTDSMTKVTSSIGKGLSAATFDSEYQRERRLNQRKNRPNNAIFGVTKGAEALATSFSSGLEGVVMKPLEGAERDGAVGFFKGVGKGLVGAITKPAVGVFDLASNFTEGIRNTTTAFGDNERHRKRVPRYTPPDGILRVYSEREATGQSWLKDLNNGEYRTEAYYAHIQIPEENLVVILTGTRALATSGSKSRIRWDLLFSGVASIANTDDGITFKSKAGREYDQIVRIKDKNSKRWFFKELEKVIGQWNAKSRIER